MPCGQIENQVHIGKYCHGLHQYHHRHPELATGRVGAGPHIRHHDLSWSGAGGQGHHGRLARHLVGGIAGAGNPDHKRVGGQCE